MGFAGGRSVINKATTFRCITQNLLIPTWKTNVYKSLRLLDWLECLYILFYFSLYTCLWQYCLLFSVRCTLFSVQCTVCTVHCTVYTVHCALSPSHCTVRIFSNTLLGSLVTLESVMEMTAVHFTLYIIHCTVYTVYCSLFTVWCAFLQFTLYTVQCWLDTT